MRSVGVEETSAIGPELLDDLLRRHGPLGDRLRRTLDGLGDGVRREVLNRPLRDEHERANDGDRQQDVQRAARDVNPEVADLVGPMAGEPADQRNRDRNTGGRRHEILHGQRRHLHQIAHRGFAAVPLPVRVRHEAHGRVERLVGAHLARAESLRIERSSPWAA
jgi:hypothetical protein